MGTRVEIKQGVMDITVSLTAMDCPNCSVVFAIPDGFDRERRADGKSFYCPNGHSMSYTESEQEKLRRKLRAAEQSRDWYRDDAQRAQTARMTAERSAAAYKGQTTRLRKRAITGTCAFCHRHFANVERHVATQHPTETPEATE
jgi:hypothetical protein